MKSLKKILEKNNLTPKERVLTIIKNTVHLNITGKGILSKSDLEAISKGGTFDRGGADEYNKYLFMWKKFEYLEIDITNLINRIQIDFANFEKVLLLYHYRDKNIEHIEKIIESQYPEHHKKSLTTILENTGIDYARVVHRLTFISLSKNIQKDILALDYNSRYDPDYLNQEEQLGEILKDKKIITKKEVKQLTDLIVSFLPWEKEKRFKELHKNYSSIIFNTYFGSYPIIELGKILAEEYDIDYEDEYELRKKLVHVHNLKRKLRVIIRKEIENGLFTKKYKPLYNSNRFETYGDDTILKHKEIYQIWISAKNKIRKKLQKMIDGKEIVIEEKTEIIFDMKFSKTIITGTSLYYGDDSNNFVREYKEQIKPIIVYGFLFNLLQEEKLNKKYGYMLAFQEIISKVSEIVGVKATDLDTKYLQQIEILANDTNSLLRGLENNISEIIYGNLEKDFYIETFFQKFQINLKNTKSVKITPHKLFIEEAQRLLGSEWGPIKIRKKKDTDQFFAK